MNKRRVLDNEWLEALAASGPAALKIVEQIRARRRRGRPASEEADYRRLALWWKAFRKLNSELTAEHAAKKFLRHYGSTIAMELNLKRDTVQSLRNAVARGEKESERVRHHRKTSWRIMPAGLAGRMLVTDPDEALLIRAAMQAALLGNT